jgi:hypothetical protein
VRDGNASLIVRPGADYARVGQMVCGGVCLPMESAGMPGEGRRDWHASGTLTVMGEGWATVESNDRRTRHSDALLCNARRWVEAPPLHLHVSGDRDEPGRERDTFGSRPDEVL